MKRGFVYLVAIKDWSMRRVLSNRVSISMTTDFCVEALEEAIARHGAPEMFNTDSKNARAGCRTRTASSFAVSRSFQIWHREMPRAA